MPTFLTYPTRKQAWPISQLPARFQKRQFLLLLLVSIVANLLALPYALAILQQTAVVRMLTTRQLCILQFLEGLLLSGILGSVGLLLQSRLGFRLPVADALFQGQKPNPKDRKGLWLGLWLGLLAGTLVLSAVLIFPQPHVLHPLQSPAAWKGLLASFSAGISEEIMMRLGLLSLFLWLLGIIFSSQAHSSVLFWVANLLSALVFASAHLPTAMTMGPLTVNLVLHVLLPNSAVGLLCGVLYWKRGLESAMVCHTCVDLVLHCFPALL